MKHLIVITLVLFVAVNINAQETKKEKKEKLEQERIKQTQMLIDSKYWQFDARRVMPSGGQGKSLTTHYTVKLDEQELSSHLPFFGRAFSVDYGSNTSPLSFEGSVKKYEIKDWKKGGWIIKLQIDKENDLIEYTFTIANTGSATLSVNSNKRQHISFFGEIVPVQEEQM